jgi:hypothetical protein
VSDNVEKHFETYIYIYIYASMCVSGSFKNVLSIHKHCLRYILHFTAVRSTDSSRALDVWEVVMALA